MDEDVIVVDDIEPQTPLTNGNHRKPSIASTSTPTITTSTRPQRAAARRRTSPAYNDPDFVSTERTTRSHAKSRVAPKLKLKLSDKAAANAPGMSFLGPYDRELDSDDEELSFEEQFILRVPEGEDSEKLKKMVVSREVGQDVWFKFKDSRRAVFHIGNSTYSSKLVDLPCIIESQKTLDNKQMFKVADICQMLLVEEKIPNEEALGNSKAFNIDDFIWPHGISPPLHHVRRRRFRKRINKRTIESVEQEVERLLEEDANADDVKYDVLENVNPDLSDSEYLEREVEPLDPQTPGGLASELGDAPTPAAGALEKHSDDEELDEDDEGDGDIDEELAAELDLALNDEQHDEDEDDEDDESEEEDEDEDDEDEDDETTQARQLLNEEIGDLEKAVQKKEHEVASAGNPLIRRRFEDMLKKLSSDLEMKRAQRDEIREKARRKKLGLKDDDGVESGGDGAGEGEDGGDGGEGDLDLGMEIAMAIGGAPGQTGLPPQGQPMNDEDMDLFGGNGEEDDMDIAPG